MGVTAPTKTAPSAEHSGALTVAAGAAALSLIPIWLKLIQTPLLLGNSLRCLISGSLILSVLTLRQRTKKPKQPVPASPGPMKSGPSTTSSTLRKRPTVGMAWLAFTVVFYATDIVLWQQSIRLLNAGTATVLNSTHTLFALIIMCFLRRSLPKALALLGCISAFLGMSLLVLWTPDTDTLVTSAQSSGFSAHTSENLYGVILGVISGLCACLFILGLRKSEQHLQSLLRSGGTIKGLSSGWVFFLSGIVLFGLSLVIEGVPQPEATDLAFIVLLSITGHALGWWLVSVGMPHISPILATNLLLLYPSMSILWAAVFLDEHLTLTTLLSFGLILGGLFAVNQAEKTS